MTVGALRADPGLAAYLPGTTLGSAARTALYVYATEGSRPDGFEDVDFSSTTR